MSVSPSSAVAPIATLPATSTAVVPVAPLPPALPATIASTVVLSSGSSSSPPTFESTLVRRKYAKYDANFIIVSFLSDQDMRSFATTSKTRLHSTIRIGIANPSGGPSLAAIIESVVNRVFAKAYIFLTPVHRNRVDQETILKQISAPSENLSWILATNGLGEVVGAVLYDKHEKNEKNDINKLAVLESHRHLGIAKHFVRYIKENKKPAELNLHCFVVEGAKPSLLDFYKKLGFSEQWLKEYRNPQKLEEGYMGRVKVAEMNLKL